MSNYIIEFNINGTVTECTVKTTDLIKFKAGSVLPVRDPHNNPYTKDAILTDYDPNDDLVVLLVLEPDQKGSKTITFNLQSNQCLDTTNPKCRSVYAIAYINDRGNNPQPIIVAEKSGAVAANGDRSKNRVKDNMGGGIPNK